MNKDRVVVEKRDGEQKTKKKKKSTTSTEGPSKHGEKKPYQNHKLLPLLNF